MWKLLDTPLLDWSIRNGFKKTRPILRDSLPPRTSKKTHRVLDRALSGVQEQQKSPEVMGTGS